MSLTLSPVDVDIIYYESCTTVQESANANQTPSTTQMLAQYWMHIGPILNVLLTLANVLLILGQCWYLILANVQVKKAKINKFADVAVNECIDLQIT